MVHDYYRTVPPESPDEDPWEAFVPDDDETDPQPEYGDFWPDDIDEYSVLPKREEVRRCFR